MSYKTSGGGYFLIPDGPAVGTNVVGPSAANTYGNWTQILASAAADLFIVGLSFAFTNQNNNYYQLDIGVGGSGSESSVGEVKTGIIPTSSSPHSPIILPFPIPVASGSRIALRVAYSGTLATTLPVTLLCINQADLVALGGDVADAVLDEVVEGSYTLRQLTRLMAAALLGELSGAGTTTIVIRDASDTKTRITATVDDDGNRSALSLDAS